MSYGNDDLVNMTATAIVTILLLTILTIITPLINKYLPTPLSSVAHSLEYYEGLGWGLITMILLILFVFALMLIIITLIRRFEGMPDW
jgi:uncharacterized Tic20 family protein